MLEFSSEYTLILPYIPYLKINPASLISVSKWYYLFNVAHGDFIYIYLFFKYEMSLGCEGHWIPLPLAMRVRQLHSLASDP